MKTVLQDLEKTAQALVAGEKGLLAADESYGTIGKRFQSVNIESTEQNRQKYRELLFTAPDIEKYISGVILFDETIRQSTSDGTPFTQVLLKRGIMPGIKVDKGTKQIPRFPGEVVTEGLDNLRDRLKEYGSMGARFAKWRAVININQNLPSEQCIEMNADALARYASLCQENGIVPIVEPEVLMEGDHDLSRCEEVTQLTLQMIFDKLYKYRVIYEAMLLKPNMVLAGKSNNSKPTSTRIAQVTLHCLKRTVPVSVPGIAFLSGGQSPVEATSNLNELNKLGPLPWKLTFSFSRALQEPVLDTWRGNDSNLNKAQALFTHRTRCASAATRGAYNDQMEKEMPA